MSSEISQANFVRDYIDYAKEVTDAPEVFHHFLSYSVLSAICRGNIFLCLGDQKVYPNFYLVLIAPSSLYRKSTSLFIAKRLIQDIDKSLLLPQEFSQEALASTLAAAPQGILFWSEFASFLSASEKEYMRGSKEFLTDLFDAPPLYSRKLKSGTVEIKNPVISVATATTLQWFLERAKKDDLKGGFLVRFLWVPASKKEKRLAIPPEADEEKRKALLYQLKAIQNIAGKMSLSNEAKKRYETWHIEHEREADSMEDRDLLGGFYSRFETYGLKFAMLNEVASTRKLTVSDQSMEKALCLIDFLKRSLRKLADEELAFGWFNQAKKGILKKLREAGKIGRSELLRSSNLTKKQFDSVMDTLIDEDRVRNKTEPTDTKPRRIYVFIK